MRSPVACSLQRRFSCKDLSRFGNLFKDKQDLLRQGLGTSGKTFAALCSFCDTALPRALIMENVDELEQDGPGSNCQFLYECFASRGYAISQQTMVSSDYGSPQKRKRTCLLAPLVNARVPSPGSLQAAAQSGESWCQSSQSKFSGVPSGSSGTSIRALSLSLSLSLSLHGPWPPFVFSCLSLISLLSGGQCDQ